MQKSRNERWKPRAQVGRRAGRAAGASPTPFGLLLAQAVVETFSEFVGREITAEELLAAERALRAGEPKGTDAEALVFLLEWLREG